MIHAKVTSKNIWKYVHIHIQSTVRRKRRKWEMWTYKMTVNKTCYYDLGDVSPMIYSLWNVHWSLFTGFNVLTLIPQRACISGHQKENVYRGAGSGPNLVLGPLCSWHKWKWIFQMRALKDTVQQSNSIGHHNNSLHLFCSFYKPGIMLKHSRSILSKHHNNPFR